MRLDFGGIPAGNRAPRTYWSCWSAPRSTSAFSSLGSRWTFRLRRPGFLRQGMAGRLADAPGDPRGRHKAIGQPRGGTRFSVLASAQHPGRRSAAGRIHPGEWHERQSGLARDVGNPHASLRRAGGEAGRRRRVRRGKLRRAEASGLYARRRAARARRRGPRAWGAVRGGAHDARACSSTGSRSRCMRTRWR